MAKLVPIAKLGGLPGFIESGPVTTVAPDVAASATLTGEPGEQVLNLSIPRGYPGYNATGAVEDQETLAAYVTEDAGRNPFGSKLKTTFATPQADYIDTLARLSNYSRIELKKTSVDNALEVSCLSDSGEYVTYSLPADTRYQYVGEVRATTGELSGSPQETSRQQVPEDFALDGTYNALDSTPYTLTAGDTWSTVVTTTTQNAAVAVQTHADDRGGLWNISVAEVQGATGTHTTWQATPGVALTDVLTIPEPGTYTIVGEFAGQDPAHPLASPRGWLNSTLSTDTAMVIVTETAREVQEISPKSNKDFAFKIKSTVGGVYEFVPYHGTESETFVEPTQYFDGGTPIDVAALAVGETVTVGSFEIVQHIYGRNSFDLNANLIEVWTTQRIAADGKYSVDGRWKTLTDVLVDWTTYPVMVMGSLPVFDQIVSSIGNTYALDGSTAPANIFLPESDTTDGYAFLSSTSGHVAGVRYNNRAETLRTGQPNKQEPDARTFIELRTGGTMAKIYPSIYAADTLLPAGTINRFSGSYFYGTIPGAHSVLSLT